MISRAPVVGALGVSVTARYVGIVVGVGASIGERQPSAWLSVLATALVAVPFQPVRERVHRFANRLVDGSRATPYEVLPDFAVSMAGRDTTAELSPGRRRRFPSAWVVPAWRSGFVAAGRWPARWRGRPRWAWRTATVPWCASRWT